MKARSWATATRSLIAGGRTSVRDRLSATLGSRAGMLTRGSAAYPPLLRGAFRMDMTWVTGRIAVGGGIWTAENMAAVARSGVTHIIDMQIEFDDTTLAGPHGVEVLWNPIEDDFQPKPPEVFQRGVEFATEALEQDETKLFIHCAAGVHRAPMMALAVLCALGWAPAAAQDLIEKERPVVDFADVYVRSVERFLDQQVKAGE
jgi:protein-tyrosine phosphatase